MSSIGHMILKSSSQPNPNLIGPGTSSFQSRILLFWKALKKHGSGSGKRKRKQLMADLRKQKRKRRKNWPLFHHCYQGRTSHSCLLCRFPSHLFDRPDLLASWQFITGQLKNFEMKVLTLEEPGVYILPRNWVVFHRGILSEEVVFHYNATYSKYFNSKEVSFLTP